MREKYQSMSRRNKAQEYIKHSVFIYSSGKFIQSSRKNETSCDITESMVKIVMAEIKEFIVPVVDEEEEYEEEAEELELE